MPKSSSKFCYCLLCWSHFFTQIHGGLFLLCAFAFKAMKPTVKRNDPFFASFSSHSAAQCTRSLAKQASRAANAPRSTQLPTMHQILADAARQHSQDLSKVQTPASWRMVIHHPSHNGNPNYTILTWAIYQTFGHGTQKC